MPSFSKILLLSLGAAILVLGIMCSLFWSKAMAHFKDMASAGGGVDPVEMYTEKYTLFRALEIIGYSSLITKNDIVFDELPAETAHTISMNLIGTQMVDGQVGPALLSYAISWRLIFALALSVMAALIGACLIVYVIVRIRLDNNSQSPQVKLQTVLA